MSELVFADGMCFRKLFATFVIGGVLGDIVETIFCYFKYKKWKSRSSFVYGHMSVVWGFAFMIATVLFYVMRDAHPVLIFIVGTVLGGIYEYLCSLIAEVIWGVKFWDYSKFQHNLSGRINLMYCFLWGIAAYVWIGFLFPIIERGIECLPMMIGSVSSNLLFILIIIDAIISCFAIYRYAVRNQNGYEQDKRWERFDYHFSNKRMEKVYPDMKLCNKEFFRIDMKTRIWKEQKSVS